MNAASTPVLRVTSLGKRRVNDRMHQSGMEGRKSKGQRVRKHSWPHVKRNRSEFQENCIMSVQQMLAERAVNPNFVPPIDDYAIGKRMFYSALAYECCTSDEMRSGWLAAESRTLGAIYADAGLAVGDAVAQAVLQ